MLPQKRVVVAPDADEQKVRGWAKKYGLTLDRGAINVGGKRCFAIKYVPSSITYRHEDEAGYTEMLAVVNGGKSIIGLVVYDDMTKRDSGGSYCVAPVIK